MGRYSFDSKVTVEACLGITTQFLKKQGHLSRKWSSSSSSCNWYRGKTQTGSMNFIVNTKELYVQFMYTEIDRITHEKTEKNYSIKLFTTSCNFGGLRYWLVCPFCQRKVGGLYIHEKNDFACRHCLDLTYESRNTTKRFRIYQKFFDMEKAHSKLCRLKTKYYKRRATRKHRALLKKVDRLFEIDYRSITGGEEGL